MPKRYFKKRYRPKFNTTKKKIYKNRKDIKRIKDLIEYKWKDDAVTIVAEQTDTTGWWFMLNGLAQAVGNARIGSEVYARSIMIRGYINNSTGGTNEDCVVRLILYRAKQSNNAEQTLALLLTAVNVNSNYYHQHASRFDILFDKTFSMDLTAHTIIPFKFRAKLAHKVKYNGNAGTYADIENNGLWLAGLSTVDVGANAPIVTATWRYSYCDA